MLSTLAPVPTVSAPTRLRLPDLLHTTDRAADDVLSGRYDRLLRGLPEDDRWYTRLSGDDELDVWLISWVPDKSTELHDHGGSLGALTVVSGSLRETRWDGEMLRQRRLSAGDQAAFPLGWVHDVVHAPDATAVPVSGARPDVAGAPAPTVSVHAYSPPLTAMSYYEVTPQNTLRRKRTELTDAPEG
ncbi:MULTISPECIES: cysteine dioxygenase family protein [unclassified Mycolicibacterium]|uniref:cysteine dioxygenase n=1 Tax=unclassified Mycolicibacterium TaxID=2636767 RepID=UPI0012DC3036|nr:MULTISPECIES: cysteine dioxygenase family protein [unclassified Mycolicibacterium]MUL85165.1 cysteine dioxygenase [Mycolicibacterium sp. CBMA 329]MUL91132.1 cysteine dioxygenase [Mycolicibacterium sp. CBMA 331]MUL98198.1 cysteine dioxygenase [Mycolicibacterium sp. CBMA 334]MUM26082.1 cysteine dioxygenase [Mycolicibacterium sp. CBMA 295]MUM40891.1 cysteine dioxygenase [Mycolicibacterium sp. CBMA 247]